MHVCSSSPCQLGSRTLGTWAAVFTTDTAIASQISKASNPQLRTSSQTVTNSDIIFNMTKEVTLQKKKRSLYRRRRGHSTEEEAIQQSIYILCCCFSGIWSRPRQGSIHTSGRASWRSLYPQTGADDVSQTPPWCIISAFMKSTTVLVICRHKDRVQLIFLQQNEWCKISGI